MPKQRKISIGVGVTICHPDQPKILVTRRRKGSNWGAGSLAMPGGHVEEFETAYDCAVRECMEETGLIVKPRLLDSYTYVYHAEEWFREGRHHWTVYVIADVVGGSLCNPEPHKHSDWKWATLTELEKVCCDKDWIPLPALRGNREKIGI